MASLLLVMIYLAFISLGLPDALLGAGWPGMYGELGVSVGDAGLLTMVCGVGTVYSALNSQRFIARFGTGKVTACSTALTAVGLLCFSLCGKFWMLCLCMIPLGFGAGCIDAALNNYVAIHYESRHMSWLHCMWGIGTTVGPYVMGMVFGLGLSWRWAYRSVGFIQLLLAVALVAALPLWSRVGPVVGETEEPVETEALTTMETIALPKAKAAAACFFFYCAVEQTAGLWAGSYLCLHKGLSAEAAAKFAGLYFLGLTVGRAISGFLTVWWNDRQLVRGGLLLILGGILCMVLPVGTSAVLVGLVLMGLGSAPIYPCMVHSTPRLFGAARSQAVVGVQMTGAFLGSCLMPPLFGVIAEHMGVAALPLELLLLLGCLAVTHILVER